MRDKHRSRTAEVAAGARAWHLLHETPIVFRDPFAIQFTPRTWQVILKSPVLNWLMLASKTFDWVYPLRAEILGRARFTEEQLEKAIKAGIDQYVLLGTGLDSFALRRKDLPSSFKVYELDHPASQTAKRSRLAKLNIDMPKNLEFVPIDFEKESVADALARSSYSKERPCFFSWLGVTMYLTREAIFSTLRSIAAYAKPNSEIVFDYMIPKEFLDPFDMQMMMKIERFVARRGEPLVSSFDPHTLPHEVCDLRFELVEHLPPTEQQKRYFADRSDDLRPASFYYFIHFRLVE